MRQVFNSAVLVSWFWSLLVKLFGLFKQIENDKESPETQSDDSRTLYHLELVIKAGLQIRPALSLNGQ